MRLRFILSDIFILDDMPDGWRDLALKIRRDSKKNSIYIDYTSDLTFFGDGWDVLKYYIDGIGICARIPTLIEIDENDSGDYEYLYNGVINLADCDIDYERCTVKGRIKNDSYLDYISAFYKAQIWYFNHFREAGIQTTFITGEPVLTTNFAKSSQIHSVATGNITDVCYTYRMIEVLNYHMQYMTANKVSVVSDFFTKTSFEQGIYQVHITGALAIGNIFDIEFTNCYGRRVIKTVTITSNDQTAAFAELANGFVQKGAFDRYFTSLFSYNTDQTSAAAYAYFDGSMFSFSEEQHGTNDIFLYHITPITDISVTSLSHAVTVTQTQELTYGMRNLFMAFNSELALAANENMMGDKRLSFDTLFDMLDSHFNLGMSLEKVGDTFQMRIEPKEYFYLTPQILDFGSVINIKAKPNTDLLLQNLIVGTKGANSNIVRGASGKNQNWSVGNCSTEVEDKNTDGNFDMTSIGIQWINFTGRYPLQYPNDIAFLLSTPDTVEEGDPTEGHVLAMNHRIKVVNTDFHGGEGIAYAFNHGLINYWSIKNHLFSLTGSPQTPSTNLDISGNYVVKNDDSAFSRMDYEFEALMNRDEIRRVIFEPTGRIGFTDNAGVHRSCSLLEMEWNINTQKAKLTLFG